MWWEIIPSLTIVMVGLTLPQYLYAPANWLWRNGKVCRLVFIFVQVHFLLLLLVGWLKHEHYHYTNGVPSLKLWLLNFFILKKKIIYKNSSITGLYFAKGN